MFSQKTDNIKQDLLNLSIPSVEKVNIWLLLHGYKQATDIINPIDVSGLKQFCLKNNLHYLEQTGKIPVIFPNQGIDWSDVVDRELFIISESQTVCQEIANIYKDQVDLFNPEKSYRLGILYGYCESAVKEFSRSMAKFPQNGLFPSTMMSNEEIEKLYSGEAWLPFLVYKPRRNHSEDLVTAKNWAKFVKTSFPKLYLEYTYHS